MKKKIYILSNRNLFNDRFIFGRFNPYKIGVSIGWQMRKHSDKKMLTLSDNRAVLNLGLIK